MLSLLVGDRFLQLGDFLVQPLGAELRSCWVLPGSRFCRCPPKVYLLNLCLSSFPSATGLSWVQGTDLDLHICRSSSERCLDPWAGCAEG